ATAFSTCARSARSAATKSSPAARSAGFRGLLPPKCGEAPRRDFCKRPPGLPGAPRRTNLCLPFSPRSNHLFVRPFASLHFCSCRSMLPPAARWVSYLGEMPENSDVTERLAQFIAETRWDALAPPVAHAAKRSLMNFFAVALTGCRETVIETMLRSLATFSAE